MVQYFGLLRISLETHFGSKTCWDEQLHCRMSISDTSKYACGNLIERNTKLKLQIFNAFLETQFKGVPGEETVLKGQYLILNVKLDTDPIRADEWALTVFPGSNLIMSVLIDQSASGKGSAEGHCPKAICRGVGNASTSQIGFKIWYLHISFSLSLKMRQANR
jgi:hypothetical protein